MVQLTHNNSNNSSRRNPVGHAPASLPGRIEWPTVLLAVSLYCAFGTLTLFYSALPWWLVFVAGGYLVALHGSLQHEVVHGHPTRWRAFNNLLVFPSLWLWLPFGIYRRTHLAHHRSESLTDPLEDPESFYLTPEQWQRTHPMSKALLTFHNTAAGRLAVGPLLACWRFFRTESQLIKSGDTSHCGAWLTHIGACAVVLFWVCLVCDIPLLEYLLLFVYPGLSLTLLRSFVEHRAHPEPERRTAIVESGALMSLLYLNNNLHALHHAEPTLPWYQLGGLYRGRQQAWLQHNGGYLIRGYGSVITQYLRRPRQPVVYSAAVADSGRLSPDI